MKVNVARHQSRHQMYANPKHHSFCTWGPVHITLLIVTYLIHCTSKNHVILAGLWCQVAIEPTTFYVVDTWYKTNPFRWYISTNAVLRRFNITITLTLKNRYCDVEYSNQRFTPLQSLQSLNWMLRKLILLCNKKSFFLLIKGTSIKLPALTAEQGMRNLYLRSYTESRCFIQAGMANQ